LNANSLYTHLFIQHKAETMLEGQQGYRKVLRATHNEK